MMFSATDDISRERGWAHYRMCFAAEAEENVDACSRRFVDGVHRFWKIKKVKELEELLKDVFEDASVQDADDGPGSWAPWLGC